MTSPEFRDRMLHLQKTEALVHAIFFIKSAIVNIAGVVTAASSDEVQIGGAGYGLTLYLAMIESINCETPLESASPAAARQAERYGRSYDIRLAGGDRLTIGELIEAQ